MTALWTAAEIAQATDGTTTGAWLAHGVSIDSRTIAKGDLFIALKGPTHDGHDHVESALNSGAAGSLVQAEPKTLSSSLKDKLVVVKNTFTALHNLGTAARTRVNAKIAAITGSVGKTGTKEALKLAFEVLGHTHATQGNLNNHWGVPLTLARMPRDTQYGVYELGMNHAGEIAPLARLVKPHVAIVTTVAAVHLEFFASVTDIADEKASIAAGLLPGGTMILPADNEHFDRMVAQAKQYRANVIAFGTAGSADAKLISLAIKPSGMQVVADIQGERVTYDLGVTGKPWAMNTIAVLAAVKAVGGDIFASAAALSRLAPTKGRGLRTEIALADGAVTVIDETYNASPVSIKALVDNLGQLKRVAPQGRILLALGDMLELGPQGPALHAELAGAILDNGIDAVFTAGALMENLHNALPREKRGGHAKESGALAPLVTAAVQPGDVVAVKGSNGSRMGKVIDALLGLGGTATQSRQKAANGH